MKEKINIFLIDGHSLFRKGLKAILSDNPDFVVKGDITSLNEKDVILACQPIDIILLDTKRKKINKKNCCFNIK